jgi:hypothetical protein
MGIIDACMAGIELDAWSKILKVTVCTGGYE